jgi:hypothetical protein
MELRVICAIGECWPTARSHSDSSEPATKVRNSGVKDGSNEWSKSETWRFTNFETALSLLPSLRKEARGCSETSRANLWSQRAVAQRCASYTYAWPSDALREPRSICRHYFLCSRLPLLQSAFTKSESVALCIVTAADSLALSMEGR